MIKEKLVIEYTCFNNLNALTSIQRELLLAAFNASSNAYAPYSKFQVGAAIILENGIILTANNQENAAYPCGICAERNLIHYCKSNYIDQKIQSIAISTRKNNMTRTPNAPCGLCRQVLVEAEINNRSDIELILGHPEAEIWIFNSCNDLLPLAFNSKNLNIANND
ncbi:MAG: cytidine deaminase [Saprospiraceae bacterium]|nr:cytidine deaminase [Saprospiraceae bacterium]